MTDNPDHLTSNSDDSSEEEIPIKQRIVEESPKSKKRKRREGKKQATKQEGTSKHEKEKVPFQRIWSDEDEITLLKGLLDYIKEKGEYDASKSKDFYDYIKESLQIDVDSNQVRGKLRKLKDKYKRSFGMKTLSPHGKKVQELGIQIWGREEYKSEGERTERNGEGKVYKGPAEMWSLRSIPMNLDESLVKLGLKKCDKDRVAKVEEKWSMLRMEEAGFYKRKIAICHEAEEMITEALRSN